MASEKCWIKKLNNRKGFTLGELMVTTIILLLSMLLITQSLDTGIRQFYQRTQHSEADILCTAIEDAIQDELIYATNVETDSDKSVTKYTSHKVGTGAAFGILSTDGTTFTPIGSVLSSSAKGYFAIDADYYKNLSGTTREYYLPISKGSYEINSGSAGKLVSAISIQADTDSNGNPTNYEAHVEIFSSNGTTAMVSDSFTTAGSTSLARTGEAVRKLDEYQVNLVIPGDVASLLNSAQNDDDLASSWSAVSGGYTTSVTEGFNITLPNLAFTDDEDDNYIRVNWKAESGEEYGAPYTVSSVEKGMTFTAVAVARPSHTITFMLNDSTVLKTVDVREGKTISASEIPTDLTGEGGYPSGYDTSELGWYEKEITSGKGSEKNPYNATLSDLYVNAEKTLYPVVKYPITFSANGGTLLDGTDSVTSSIRYGNKIISSAPMDPDKEGMAFVGWFTNLEDDTTELSSVTQVSGPAIYKAKWAYRYTVTYVLDGGTLDVGKVPGGKQSGINIVVNLDSDTATTLSYTICSVPPTREGYDFDGWSDGEKTYRSGESISVNKDITLTAQWKGYTVNLYNGDVLAGTFTCNKNGGDIKFISGESLAHLRSTLRHGKDITEQNVWRFNGWYNKASRDQVIGLDDKYVFGVNLASLQQNGVIRLDAGFVNNDTIYTRASSLSDGKSYIIVNANGIGTKKALSWNRVGSNDTVTFPDITVSSGTIYPTSGSGATQSAYILKDNAKEDGTLVAWTAETSNYSDRWDTYAAFRLKRVGGDATTRYLYVKRTEQGIWGYSYSLDITTSSTVARRYWYANNCLYERESKEYINPLISGFELNSSNKTIYLYESQDAGTYLAF